MLGARLLVALLSGATLVAVLAASDTVDDHGRRRTKRGGEYEYVGEYFPPENSSLCGEYERVRR